jgi:hypothetical protein
MLICICACICMSMSIVDGAWYVRVCIRTVYISRPIYIRALNNIIISMNNIFHSMKIKGTQYYGWGVICAHMSRLISWCYQKYHHSGRAIHTTSYLASNRIISCLIPHHILPHTASYLASYNIISCFKPHHMLQNIIAIEIMSWCHRYQHHSKIGYEHQYLFDVILVIWYQHHY